MKAAGSAYAFFAFGRPVLIAGTAASAAVSWASSIAESALTPARRTSLFFAELPSNALRRFNAAMASYSSDGIVKLSRTSFSFTGLSAGGAGGGGAAFLAAGRFAAGAGFAAGAAFVAGRAARVAFFSFMLRSSRLKTVYTVYTLAEAPGTGGVRAAAPARNRHRRAAQSQHSRLAATAMRLRAALPSLLLLHALAAAGSASAATVWDETASGDLSDDGLQPTALVVSTGSNEIHGSVGNAGQGIDRDYFRFAVPEGAVLKSLVLLGDTSVSGSASFIAVQAGPQVTVSPTGAGSEQLLGFMHYGIDLVGNDLLPAMGIAAPLPGGVYSFWVQETGGPVAYGIDLTIAAVPEPGAGWLWTVGLLSVLGVRTRARAASCDTDIHSSGGDPCGQALHSAVKSLSHRNERHFARQSATPRLTRAITKPPAPP
jgi:hypothetical protein